MKKTTLAIILALALTLSLGSAAFAAESIGSITFVRDPEDFTREQGVYDSSLASLGIDFGEVTYTDAGATYDSTTAKRGGADLTDASKYAGLEVVHRQGPDVHVTVAIGGFTPGTFEPGTGRWVPDHTVPGSPSGAGSVLQGFALELVPSEKDGHSTQSGTDFHVDAKTGVIINANGGLVGTPMPIISADTLTNKPIDEKAPNEFTQLYSGKLTVPGSGNNVDIPEHHAQATLVWTYETGPVA